jgi:antitoxin PrlF
MATSAQKVGPKFQVTIPKKIRDALGIKAGDLVETSLTREGAAVIRPVVLVPKKVDLKKRLEAAERAVKEGRVFGPFNSAAAVMRAVKQQARARRSH